MTRIQCNRCNSTNIDTYSTCGNVVCASCGIVLDDSNIFEEVQHIKDSSGVSRVAGKFITFENILEPKREFKAKMVHKALVISSKIHNFNRTINDIIEVVKVCQATLQERLSEFGITPFDKLFIEDFKKVDLSEDQDPQFFANVGRILRELEKQDKLKELEDQTIEFQKQIENARKQIVSTEFSDNYSNPKPNSSLINIDMLITKNAMAVSSQERESILESKVNTNEENKSKQLMPISECTDIETKKDENFQVTLAPNAVVECHQDSTKIDDSTLHRYFIQLSEYVKNELAWDQLKAECLEELKEQKELEVKENIKETIRKERDLSQVNSTEDDMPEIFHQGRVSQKLDYDVLKSLSTENNSLDNLVELEQKADSKFESDHPPVIRSLPKPKFGEFSNAPLNIRKMVSNIMSGNRWNKTSYLPECQSSSKDYPVKKIKLSKSADNTRRNAVEVDSLIIKNHDTKDIN